MLRTMAIAAALAALPVTIQAQDDTHARALAAGYKSAFLCSGLFNADQTPEQIASDDLEGIYVQYQTLVRSLPATIDRGRRMVSVTFDPKQPPRIAAWRPDLGCTQLPIGAGADGAALLPQLTARRPASNPDALPWPDGDAVPHVTTPEAVAATVARAFDGESYGAGTRTTAVLVIHDGKIIAERYRDGYDLHTPQRTWSVAKSITATLIGRAAQLDLLKVDAPARVPEWQTPGDPRAAITLAQLMHMNSGLWTNGPGNRTDEVYLGGGLVTQQATAMALEAAPGTRFRYANDDPLLAARSLRAALGDGQRAIDFPYAELFWRIGMNHTTAETDWQGNYILSSQVWSTARDLGRLGLLYLNDGMWRGQRLLPAGWSRFVATPGPAQPARGGGYGAFFWLYGPAQGLPAGTYVMDGNRGQYVIIVPDRNTIIIRRGFDQDDSDAFSLTKFARDVLAGME